MKFSVVWAMPSRWTFEIKPIGEFIKRHMDGCNTIVDPFAGKSILANYRNDITQGGKHAADYLAELASQGIVADLILFDPPYSPRQVSECYKEAGIKCGMQETQNGMLYKQCRQEFEKISRYGTKALCFGWQSTGMGNGWKTVEVMLVQHGGGHNDTICVAQVKSADIEDAC